MRSDPLTSSSLIDIKQQKTHRKKKVGRTEPKTQTRREIFEHKMADCPLVKPQHLLLRPDRIGLFPYVTWLLAKWPVTPITYPSHSFRKTNTRGIITIIESKKKIIKNQTYINTNQKKKRNNNHLCLKMRWTLSVRRIRRIIGSERN